MKVIGLMSGTSADGIDAALCEISGHPPALQARIVSRLFVPYSTEVRRQILDACLPGKYDSQHLCLLNQGLGEQFAEVALKLIDQAGLTPSDIDLIGSHGQTVWHEVALDGEVVATLQIGEASTIAERTGITTISNFRARDVAAGGQGAPLTAYVDWLLLRHPDHWRAVQNIGGMANVTLLPPLSDLKSPPIAFDTGPGNALIDAAVYQLTEGEQQVDLDGRLAVRGRVDEEWLAALLSNPYFSRKPPKTTGRELFGTETAMQLVRDGLARGLRDVDIVANLTMLTAHSIADAYRRFAPAPVGDVILGGGGARNRTLVDMLSSLLSHVPIKLHEDIGLDSDFKEALVFAVLAYETWHGRPGNHPAITGAGHPAVLGQITPGHHYPERFGQTWITK